MNELTQQQLLDIYDLVFSSVHSIGFKMSEVKDLLFDDSYWFLEKPNDNWYSQVMSYLKNINKDSIVKINPLLIPKP